MTHLKILTVSAVAACLTAVAAPALADTGDSFNFAFRYDQADLADADGVARVHAALNSAAYSACQISLHSSTAGGVGRGKTQNHRRSCRRRVLGCGHSHGRALR